MAIQSLFSKLAQILVASSSAAASFPRCSWSTGLILAGTSFIQTLHCLRRMGSRSPVLVSITWYLSIRGTMRTYHEIGVWMKRLASAPCFYMAPYDCASEFRVLRFPLVLGVLWFCWKEVMAIESNTHLLRGLVYGLSLIGLYDLYHLLYRWLEAEFSGFMYCLRAVSDANDDDPNVDRDTARSSNNTANGQNGQHLRDTWYIDEGYYDE